jgi:hypothetical protein
MENNELLENKMTIQKIDHILMTFEFNFGFKVSDNILLLLCYDLDKEKIKEELIIDLIKISKLRKNTSHMPTSKFFYRRLYDDQFGGAELEILNNRMDYLSYAKKMSHKEDLDRKRVIRIMKRFFKIYSRKIALGCSESTIKDLVDRMIFCHI